MKHTSWSYENEYRCTIATNAPKSPYITAKPKGIYVGMSCSEEYASVLKDIAKSEGIDIYKMEFDDLGEEYTLVEKPYN